MPFPMEGTPSVPPYPVSSPGTEASVLVPGEISRRNIICAITLVNTRGAMERPNGSGDKPDDAAKSECEGLCVSACCCMVTALCDKKGSSIPCACVSGSVMKRNDEGLYICIDKCADDTDCPSHAVCRQRNCYCAHGLCNKSKPECQPLIKLDEECVGHSADCRGEGIAAPPPSRVGLNLAAATGGRADKTSTTSPTTQPSTIVQATTPEIEEKKCQPEPSPELEECRRLNRQDTLCSLLRSNARIQEQSCHSNISVKEVVSQFTEVFNQTHLTNLSASDLSTAVTSILENVETSLLETFTKDLRNQSISTPELEVQMTVSSDICTGETSNITLHVLGNTMEVPCSLVSRETGGAIFISQKALDSRLNSSVLGALGDSDHEGTNEIISQVVSGAITSNNTENLDPPVSFYLAQLKELRSSFIFKCVFWDKKQKVWSSVGCETKQSDKENHTICVCNHLSTFAVLMAPGEIQVDFGLVLISRIGLTLSLVCLCVSLLTFLLCHSLRSVHTSVLIVLCGCLFLGQLLVLFGLHQTWNTVLCSVIAGSLHFFFLSAFCWMSVESILLFITVRHLQAMNYMTAHRSHFPYVYLVGFGIPLIIVGISAAIRSDGYRNDRYCWLDFSLVWSFLGPVCVFIIINFTLLVLTFYLLKKKLASLNSNVSTLKHTRLLTFKAMSQLFILGCTWIVGLFQFGNGALVASYIFTICNSLQGVYIFFVHCLLNRQVREEYSRVFCRIHSKKSESEVISGSTIPMTMKFSEASDAQKSEIVQRENPHVAFK
ncbi:adhesion G protein-coupled receptor E3-like [Pseudophryne corroboree]|uniref:adhesion G protein-coupled receptor E3-like n=1 Tax=Pseudophryne corroboree TaxID=495146 RepID=UPI0030815CED